MSAPQNRCDSCHKFASYKGATYASMFDFAAMECSFEAMRCAGCTVRLGPVKSNARPCDGDTTRWEWSASEEPPPMISDGLVERLRAGLERAEYLIDRYRTLHSGKPVRDLDEAEASFRRARSLLTGGSDG